ncbi:amino acid ABC transporter permease [Dactylosporangium sp. CA-233914]|uniref:amino acid ABC transporter permease n=1 Tax=Dactylosporangium sp. CA-233914 TaxID=3239934 RepID=UPI003D8E96CB
MQADRNAPAIEAVRRAATEAPARRTTDATARVHEANLAVRQHRPWGGVAVAVVVLLLLAGLVQSVVRAPAMEWDVVGHYLFNRRILSGVWTTISLTAISMVLALVLAVVLAIMRLADTWALRRMAELYVWFFRSTPVLVLLIITFNLALIFPELKVGIPGTSFNVSSGPTNELISPFWAAILAFALNEAAYAAEILRTAILAVSKGQVEAGIALGMTNGRIYRRVILPQAVRIAIPPLSNDVINLLKGTSLVAFISVFDLMYTAEAIYQINFKVFPLLMVVTIWYIVMVTVLSVFQSLLERKLRGRGRGRGRGRRPSKRPRADETSRRGVQ